VPEAMKLEKAKLVQLDSDFKKDIEPDTAVTVQFNPESLKVTFANQLVQPKGAGDQKGTPSRQFVGAGTTKLALTLWFDVGSPQDGDKPVNDVRKLTQKVAFFITPKDAGQKKDSFTPPGVSFRWGTFRFDGLMDSLEETLEYFSPEGRPLRASLALSLSQQQIRPFAFGKAGAASNPPAGAGTPGTNPLAQAPAGSSVQSLADGAGLGANWQGIAAANGIENPRLLAPGALLDLNLSSPQFGISLGVQGGALGVAAATASIGASAGLSAPGGADASAGASASAGANGSIGGSF
jgi:hypothetical protein